ncbi:MAG: HAMP domain-containing histidine kinase [Sedimentisphaerales bacterium]|nr:HAMP domain-containing histidine kinase [Sedimentisphaerales bacterium]
MASLLEKRRSLHQNLQHERQRNNRLRNEIGQMQALANIGLVSSMIAHEMNNILTPLGTYAELALQNPEDSSLVCKTLKKTIRNSERATKILESMLAMARGQMQTKQHYRLVDLVEEIFACLARDFKKDGIRVVKNIEPDLYVWAEGVCLQQVFMNLILNAREAMLNGGGVLSIQACETQEQVRIEFSDTGGGIEPENMERIFDPFFTTKVQGLSAPRNGAGLGLAFCRRVIEEHNGVIQVSSEPGRGTSFILGLPKDTGWRLDGGEER